MLLDSFGVGLFCRWLSSTFTLAIFIFAFLSSHGCPRLVYMTLHITHPSTTLDYTSTTTDIPSVLRLAPITPKILCLCTPHAFSHTQTHNE